MNQVVKYAETIAGTIQNKSPDPSLLSVVMGETDVGSVGVVSIPTTQRPLARARAPRRLPRCWLWPPSTWRASARWTRCAAPRREARSAGGGLRPRRGMRRNRSGSLDFPQAKQEKRTHSSFGVSYFGASLSRARLCLEFPGFLFMVGTGHQKTTQYVGA